MAGEAEGVEEAVEVDPGGHGIVVTELELVFLAGEGEAFDQSGLAVDAGQAAAAIFEATGDDFESEAGVGGAMGGEQGGIGLGAEGIDVVKEEVLEVGMGLEESGEGAVAEEVRDFEEMPDRMEALEGEVVGVIGGFAGLAGPLDEGLAEAVADFFLLFVESLLGGFLPLKAEVAFGGDEAEADGAAGGEEDRARVVVVLDAIEPVGDGLVGEVAGGEDVGDGVAGEFGELSGFGEVDFEEGAVVTGEMGEGMEGFDDTGALGPAGAGTCGEGDHGQFATAEGLETLGALGSHEVGIGI